MEWWRASRSFYTALSPNLACIRVGHLILSSTTLAIFSNFCHPISGRAPQLPSNTVSIVAKMLYKVFKLKYLLAKLKYILKLIFLRFGVLKPHNRSLHLMRIFCTKLGRIKCLLNLNQAHQNLDLSI